jgi:hypothetical protein
MEFWLVVAVVLAAVLGAAALVDRAARRRGHDVRGGGAIWEEEVREHRRDVHAGDMQGHMDADRSWTRHHRRGGG